MNTSSQQRVGRKNEFWEESEAEKEIPYYKERNKRMNAYLNSKKKVEEIEIKINTILNKGIDYLSHPIRRGYYVQYSLQWLVPELISLINEEADKKVIRILEKISILEREYKGGKSL